jgi:hypothetical protein
VHRTIAHSGILGLRYNGSEGPVQLRTLNGLANRFAAELKGAELGGDFRERVLALYPLDQTLWQRVEQAGGDIPASQVWPA